MKIYFFLVAEAMETVFMSEMIHVASAGLAELLSKLQLPA